jgi:transcriptional regulator of met regulon
MKYSELGKVLNDHDDECSHVKPVKHLSTRHLTKTFKHTNTAFPITDDNDANKERCAEVSRETNSAEACCKKTFCSKRQKAPSSLSK